MALDEKMQFFAGLAEKRDNKCKDAKWTKSRTAAGAAEVESTSGD
jgi:hypothetical protein